MGHEDIAFWFIVLFAIGIGIALVVRGFRSRKNEPVIRRDREQAIARASRPPRQQHYRFAHVLLRDAVLADPEGTWAALTTPGDFLVGMWTAATDASETPIAPTGLRVDVEDEIAVVTLPPPARIAEVYMIAIVRDPVGYFVLERGSESAFLAEWRKDMRIRMGDVTTTSKRELLAAVRSAR